MVAPPNTVVRLATPHADAGDRAHPRPSARPGSRGRARRMRPGPGRMRPGPGRVGAGSGRSAGGQAGPMLTLPTSVRAIMTWRADESFGTCTLVLPMPVAVITA